MYISFMYFSDGSTICDTGWIGYETHCYKFDPDIHDRTDWWYDNDVVMTSVTTREEYLFLIKYLRSKLYLRIEHHFSAVYRSVNYLGSCAK